MAQSPQRILVIEDEKPMARALELKLGRAGYVVTAVFNGESGLQALDQGPYDIILCDLIMPKMDGFQVLEALRSRAGAPPVIIMTNLSSDEDRQRVLELGARAFVVKSDTPILEIVERVRTELGNAS